MPRCRKIQLSKASPAPRIPKPAPPSTPPATVVLPPTNSVSFVIAGDGAFAAFRRSRAVSLTTSELCCSGDGAVAPIKAPKLAPIIKLVITPNKSNRGRLIDLLIIIFFLYLAKLTMKNRTFYLTEFDTSIRDCSDAPRRCKLAICGRNLNFAANIKSVSLMSAAETVYGFLAASFETTVLVVRRARSEARVPSAFSYSLLSRPKRASTALNIRALNSLTAFSLAL